MEWAGGRGGGRGEGYVGERGLLPGAKVPGSESTWERKFLELGPIHGRCSV